MNMTLGKRIAQYRKEKGLTQEALAQAMNVSAQAVSKWENDLTCPDIASLPLLSKILGVTVDELLSGKSENLPTVAMQPLENRKAIEEMMLRIVVDTADGDKVRVNLPMALIKVAIELGVEMPQVSGNSALKNIDFKQIFDLVSHGAIGNLVEVESSNGDTVRIFVE
ncbi:MAG: helix-turn-helix transcriptional regulator [Clostridia bacterium]|nr:helix-turn-helix transcriptional regulator [Clostridiales bacterium]MBQ3232322.1 helix-turn-helix transcriptional regulator [Clostridia bacterium]